MTELSEAWCQSSIQMLSHVQLFATPWAVARQAPLFMEFPRQEYWSELPCPPPGDLPDSGIEPASSAFPALASRFFLTAPPGKPLKEDGEKFNGGDHVSFLFAFVKQKLAR